MCGRFVRISSIADIAQAFDVAHIACDLNPSYNIAPGDQLAALVQEGDPRSLVSLRWGLLPAWAKEPSIGNKLINARAETLTAKASFKTAFKKRRCLIVADGFYEWRKTIAGKTPMYIHLRSGQPFGFAGLYERWTSPEGASVHTCTMITTEPNHLIQSIHHRMPVILPHDHHARWLDPVIDDEMQLLALLQPFPADEMNAYEVSRLVNSPKNNSVACIEPVSNR